MSALPRYTVRIEIINNFVFRYATPQSSLEVYVAAFAVFRTTVESMDGLMVGKIRAGVGTITVQA
jgi:hypothetical protein